MQLFALKIINLFLSILLKVASFIVWFLFLQETLEEIDKNKDGQISIEEYVGK